MGSLRIGINALYLIPGRVGGTEIYLRSLLRALGEVDSHSRYFVFTNLETATDIAPESENFTVEQLPVKATFRPARIIAEQTTLRTLARKLELDVLLNPGFTAPLLSPCPCVTVFHDLQHKRHPEFFRWFDLPFWRALLYGSAHRSARLIAVSETTRDDLLRYYRLDPRKIAVVPHGVDPEFFSICREPNTQAPFVLCVSTLHPHKNLDRLIRVFARFRGRYRLVIAGLRGFHANAIERLIDSTGSREWVRLTGWIPREELYELFRTAHAFVYPSTFEGFGMPVLEALAAGLPTACSSIAPLPGVAGNAAVYFDPHNEEAMLSALMTVVDDCPERARLQAEGPVRARQFTWRRAAEQTLSILQEAALQRR